MTRVGRPPAVIAVACALAVCAATGQRPAAASWHQQSEPARLADSPIIEQLLKDADALLRTKPVEARALLNRALASAQAAGLESLEAHALVALGEIEYFASKDQLAKDDGVQAALIAAKVKDLRVEGRANHLLGLVAQRAGDRVEAEVRYGQAAVIFEKAGYARGISLATLGMAQVANGGLAAREPLYERAANDARSAGDLNLEGQAFHGWGDALFTVGQYEKALQKLDTARRLFESGGDSVALGTVYNSVGRLYRTHGQVEMALTYQLRALAIHERTSSAFNHMQSLNAVAVTYQILGDSRSARAYLERAVALARQSSSPRIQDFFRANLASTLIDQEEYSQAARMLEGVLTRALDSYPSVRYIELSEAYLKLGRLDAALDAADKGLDRCGAREDLACFDALDRRSEVQAARGDTTASLADLRSAVDLLEHVRARLVPADFFKQQFGQAQATVYSRTIGMQFRQGQAREALETAELARSRAFVDLLATRGVASADVDPSTAMPGAPDRRSSVTASPASAGQLAAVAARLQSTLLMYWVADDRLFIWTMAPGGKIRTASVAVRASRLAELVRSTVPLKVAPRASASAWRDLYDVLIRPIRAALPTSPGALVTIVPHGPLAMLSFAALQDEGGRYLIEDYTLHYAPAGAVLQFTAAKRRPDARTASMLIVADPVLAARSTLDRELPALPGARAEARAIAGIAPRHVTLFEGRNATEPNVRNHVAGKGVLHLATHAIVSDTDPFGSFLALGRSSSEEQGDGVLTAKEIYDLSLHADLVVLSACRSGGGRVTGDGIATFARAFIYAGSATLITSVWDVADEASARLMPDFYRRWRSGASKAEALRLAQLALLHDLRAGTVKIESAAGSVILPDHPALWAGFALFGEPD